MQYRREIDGLRAVAVVPVLFFHAGFATFSGGYVGVDVFFVISGYLITTIIVTELAAGRFSLIRFYERRARRILPALFAVMLACIPLAWLLMLPDDLENFGQSVVATTLSANNILLTMTSGYWDLAAEFKPLLHTWSLAVEEQFYVLFPALMLILWPWLGRRSGWALGILAAVSFALCLYGVSRHPTATFYLPHTRAWELLLGSLVALWLFTRAQPANDLLAAAGLLLIVAAILTFDAATPFPSAWALLPTVGTALVILYAGERTLVARLLGNQLFVGIGLISYSLYLWHQPLLVFARINSYEQPSPQTMLGVVALAFLLAFLTWHFIERPFRDRRAVPLKLLVPGAVSASVALVAAGFLFHDRNGYPERMFAGSSETAANMHIGYNTRVFRYKTERFAADGRPRLLVLGDSQARDFVNMAEETGRFAGYDLVYRDDLPICAYPDFAEGLRHLVSEAEYLIVADSSAGKACFGALLDRGLFRDHRVVIVGPKHFGYNLNKFAQLPVQLRPFAMTRVFDEIAQDNRDYRALLPRGSYLDILSHVSDDGAHMPVFDAAGQILSGDRVHITQAGAAYLGRAIFDDPAWAAFPAFPASSIPERREAASRY